VITVDGNYFEETVNWWHLFCIIPPSRKNTTLGAGHPVTWLYKSIFRRCLFDNQGSAKRESRYELFLGTEDKMPASSRFPPDSRNSNELPLCRIEICEVQIPSQSRPRVY
jgi:hypothetical protein